MIIYNIIHEAILILGNGVKFPIVYRSMLRFNLCTTLVIATVGALSDMAAIPSSPLYGNRAAMLAVYFITVLTFIVLIRPDKIIEGLIINCFYQFLYNIIGTALIAIIAIIYGAVSGADSSTWFSFSTSTVSDYIIRCISLILCFGISLIICRKCVPLMSNVSRRLKHLLFAGVVLPVFIFVVLKHIADPNHTQLFAGPLIICYGILLVILTVSFLVFFISIFVQIKEENRLVQAKIEAQSEYYRRVLRVQQELREAKHDLANRLAAYNISHNTDKKQGRI